MPTKKTPSGKARGSGTRPVSSRRATAKAVPIREGMAPRTGARPAHPKDPAQLPPERSKQPHDRARKESRLRADEALIASEVRYRRLFESAQDGILIVNTETGVVDDANPLMIELFGYPRDEVVGKKLWDLGFLADVVASRVSFAKLRRKKYVRYELLLLETFDRRRIDVEFVSNAYRVEDRTVIQCNIRDITERKRAEARITQLNRLLRTISEINKMIVRTGDRQELLDQACRMLVEFGGFKRSWIGVSDESAGRITVASSAFRPGFEGTFPSLPLRGGPGGGSPAVQALASGAPALWPDLVAASVSSSWAAAAVKAGIRSTSAFPFRIGGEVAGMLSVCSDEALPLAQDEAVLMAELAGDLGYALGAIEDRTTLRQEQGFIAALLDSLPGIVYCISPDLRFRRWNDNFERASGYDAAEMATLSPLDLFAGEDKALVAARIQEVFERGQSDVEADFVSKDGSRTPYYLTGLSVEIDGRPNLVGFGIDMSARRKAEEKLRESEERFRILFEQATDGMLLADAETKRLMLANPQMHRMLGYSEEELRKLTVVDLHPAAELPSVIADFERQARGETSLSPDLPVRRKDGSVFYVSITTARVRLQQRNCLLGVFRDITERKQAEQALRESEARFQLLAKTAPVGIFRTGEQGNTTYVNQRWTEISGLTADQALDDGWLQAVHPDDRDRLLAGWHDALQAKGESLVDYRFLHPDGTVVWVAGQANAVLDAAGRFAGYVGTITDITDRKRAEEALREEEHFLSETQRIAHIGGWSWDLKGLIKWTDETNRIYGVSPETSTPTAESLLNLLHPEDRPAMQRWIEACSAGQSPDELEFRAIRPDGSVRYLQGRGELFYGTENSPAYMAGTVQDITEHKHAEHLQAAIYEISEAAQEAASLDNLYADVHRIVGRLLDARNLYIALYDAADDLVTLPYFVDEEDETPPPQGPRRGLTGYVIRTGQPLLATPEVFEDLCRRGEVESIGAPSIDWLGVPLIVGGETIGALVVQTYRKGVRYGEREKNILTFVSRQVAQAIARKRAEEALTESEERYRLVQQSAPVGVFHFDTNLHITDCNEYFVRILGSKRERLVGLDMNRLNDRRVLPAILTAVQGGLGEYEGPYQATTGSAAPFVILRTAPLHGEGGGIIGGVGIVEDTTERRRLGEHLRQAQKMEAVGSLAGGVAHDFNNLLQALLSQTQLLQAYAQEPERVKALGLELGQQISHGASLTRQLLLFSRRETTKPEPLDLNEVVKDATRMLRRLMRANIALEIKLAPEALPVTADRGQLEQVLMNLTLNASDAMSGSGKLTIRTGALDRDRVWLTVQDTGVGIPESIRDRIFEPFFTTKGTGKGTGLGLSVVHGIVTRHGGTIEVESEVGKGSTFRVILPRVGSGEVAAVNEVPKAVAELPEGQGERILVVEDEDAAREGLRDILRSLGYDVIAAGSGEEALELPAERPFDVLLTDLMLPGISGPQLVAGLQERWPSMRIILMSGYTEDEAIRRGIGEGNVRFLQKPFDMTRLACEIRAVLKE